MIGIIGQKPEIDHSRKAPVSDQARELRNRAPIPREARGEASVSGNLLTIKGERKPGPEIAVEVVPPGEKVLTGVVR